MQGQIIDASHAGVPDTEIKARNALTGLERNTRTDSSGKFSIAGLPIAGPYDVTASKQGFASGLLSGITLAGGETANVTIELNVAAERNRITVTGVVGEIRTDEPQLGDLLTATQMEETPLPDRKITYLPLLNAANRPAINQGDVFMNENLFTTNGAGAARHGSRWMARTESTCGDGKPSSAISRLRRCRKWTCSQTHSRRNTAAARPA